MFSMQVLLDLDSPRYVYGKLQFSGSCSDAHSIVMISSQNLHCRMLMPIYFLRNRYKTCHRLGH